MISIPRFFVIVFFLPIPIWTYRYYLHTCASRKMMTSYIFDSINNNICTHRMMVLWLWFTCTYLNFSFFGFVSAPDPLFVVMEYAKLGKLQSVLRNSRGISYYTNTHGPSSLTSHELIMFCYQIAKGMDFLSSKGVRWTYCLHTYIILDIMLYCTLYNA